MGVSGVASLIFNILFAVLLIMEIFQRAVTFCMASYDQMEESTKKMISDFFGKNGALSRQRGDFEEMKKMLMTKSKQYEVNQDEDENEDDDKTSEQRRQEETEQEEK